LLSSRFVPEHVKSREGLLRCYCQVCGQVTSSHTEAEIHDRIPLLPISFIFITMHDLLAYFLTVILCDIHYNLSWSELNSKQIPTISKFATPVEKAIVTHVGLKGWLVARAHYSSSMDVERSTTRHRHNICSSTMIT
jgi:hypothetical protein